MHILYTNAGWTVCPASDGQFVVFMPSGHYLPVDGDTEARLFRSLERAVVYIDYRVAFRPSMTGSERRELRRVHGDRIGLNYDQARGFFNAVS